MSVAEDPVFRVMRTMSPAEITVRVYLWMVATLALLGALIANAVLFAAVCNGAVSLWALPFTLASALWLVMAGPRAAERWHLYGTAEFELVWWGEWRDRNGLAKDGEQ